MKLYKYSAYNQFGKVETGIFPAESEKEVVNFLSRLNLVPIKIKPSSEFFLFKLLRLFKRRIKLSQKIYLARNLHLILKSGLELSKGLDILIQESKGGFRDFLLYLKYTIEKGEYFHRAFAVFSHSFSTIEIEMIKAGEVSGNLQKNLLRWSQNLERTREVRRQIISDLMYPILVLALAFGVMMFLMLYVLPRITQLLEQIAKNPPFLTRMILGFSNFIRGNLNILISSSILVIFILFLFFISQKGRNFLKNLFTKLPLIKSLFLYLSLSDSLFIIRSLVESGVHLTEAFRLTAYATGHPRLKEAFLRIEGYIKTGETVPAALRREKAIPSLLSNILGVASESGALIEVLDVMEDFYRKEASLKMKTLLNLMEPLILIFLGVVVGFVAVSVILPIYQQISKQLEFQQQRGGGMF